MSSQDQYKSKHAVMMSMKAIAWTHDHQSTHMHDWVAKQMCISENKMYLNDIELHNNTF